MAVEASGFPPQVEQTYLDSCGSTPPEVEGAPGVAHMLLRQDIDDSRHDANDDIECTQNAD